jgi:hypothetical protein
MFMLVSRRYERASLIITSNKPFSAWGEIFGDETTAVAMIDRLVHHADILSLKGDSYRLTDRDLGPRPARQTAEPPEQTQGRTSRTAADAATRPRFPGRPVQNAPQGGTAAGSALRSALRASLHAQPAQPPGVGFQPALQGQLSTGLDNEAEIHPLRRFTLRVMCATRRCEISH